MKNIILIISLLLSSLSVFSQTDTLEIKELREKVEQLQIKARQLQTELRNQKTDFSKQISVANNEIANLQKYVQNNNNVINQTKQELGIKIATAETSTNQKISEVGDSLNKTTLWVIIGILFAVIVSGILYLFLRKKQQSDKTDLIFQLSNTKQSIDEKLINEFAKNSEALEALSQLSKPTQSAELDHSLALKVASEINLIERNINLMDSKTKGLKQLARSVEKLKDNLTANGYEIPQLLGKEFNQGMKVIVSSSIPDESIEKGVEIITKILIPQVNFNGMMIQTAQIEVSVGY